MKYTINHISTGENEVIVNYTDMNQEVERIINFIKGERTKLIGWSDKEQKLIDSKAILYIETVDGKTFAYTEEDVLRLVDKNGKETIGKEEDTTVIKLSEFNKIYQIIEQKMNISNR